MTISNTELLVLVLWGLSAGVFHPFWIGPILKKRWSFYPEEIYYALIYGAGLSAIDLLFAHYKSLFLLINLGVGFLVMFCLRQIAWVMIKIMENRL